MGSSSDGHFNAFQKERLGWLSYGGSPAIVTADTSGSYTMDAYAAPTSGVKAIRIPRDTDPVTGQLRWYYLENRQAVGFDDYLATWRFGPAVLNGVVFHVGTWGDANSSFILHMTPASSASGDLALAEGASYSDPVAGVTITVDAVNSIEATVTVSYGPQSCVRAAPTIDLKPSGTDWSVPGTPVSYIATVSNNDSDACADAVFDLTTQVPTDWTATLSDFAISAAPGTSASANLIVTSSTSAADDTYDITVVTTHQSNPELTDSSTAAYTVSAEVAANNPPVAVDDSTLLPLVEPVVIDVLVNDWDPDNDALRITTVSQAAKGSVVNNGNGTLSYPPGRRFKNRDSFSYAISDGTDSATATVFIALQESSKGGGKGGGKPNK